MEFLKALGIIIGVSFFITLMRMGRLFTLFTLLIDYNNELSKKLSELKSEEDITKTVDILFKVTVFLLFVLIGFLTMSFVVIELVRMILQLVGVIE